MGVSCIWIPTYRVVIVLQNSKGILTIGNRSARDGEEFAVRSTGGDWFMAWHPALVAPEGAPHRASGIWLTADGGLVLISNDGKRWGLRCGRPMEHELWEQTPAEAGRGLRDRGTGSTARVHSRPVRLGTGGEAGTSSLVVASGGGRIGHLKSAVRDRTPALPQQQLQFAL